MNVPILSSSIINESGFYITVEFANPPILHYSTCNIHTLFTWIQVCFRYHHDAWTEPMKARRGGGTSIQKSQKRKLMHATNHHHSAFSHSSFSEQFAVGDTGNHSYWYCTCMIQVPVFVLCLYRCESLSYRYRGTYEYRYNLCRN